MRLATSCASGIGVGVTFDGASLWYSCYNQSPDLFRADPKTGAVTASYNIAGGLGALAYDAADDVIFAGNGGPNAGEVYKITLDAQKAVSGHQPIFNTCSFSCSDIDDGLAYDGGTGTLYYSPDVSRTIWHLATDGTVLGSFPWIGTSCYNSGLAIGDQLLFEGGDGCTTVWVVDKATPATLDFSFSTPGTRDESLACDNVTFGQDAIWSKDAYTPEAYAFAIPAGTCGVGGQPVAAPPDAVDAEGLDSSAVVTWDPPLDPGTLTVTGYHVQTIDDATGQVVDDETVCADCYSLIVPNLVNGTGYYFAVSAAYATGESAAATSNSTTVEPTYTPGADLGDPTDTTFDQGSAPDASEVDPQSLPDGGVDSPDENDPPALPPAAPADAAASSSSAVSPTDTNYSEDDGTVPTGSGPSYQALSPGNSDHPPDPNIAVGPEAVVETVNDWIGVFDPSVAGPPIMRKNLYRFFNQDDKTLAPNGKELANNVTDPRVLYDVRSNRFIMTAFDEDKSAQTAHLLLAVSKTDDPTAGWRKYTNIDDTLSGLQDNFGVVEYGDQPRLGVDKTGIYVSVNFFPFGSNNFDQSRIFVFNKHALMSGPPGDTSPWESSALRVKNGTDSAGNQLYAYARGVQPATTLTRSAGEWMISAWGSTARVLSLWHVVGAGGPSKIHVLKSYVGVAQYNLSVQQAPQKGTNVTVDVKRNTGQISSAYVKNGTMYTVQGLAGPKPSSPSIVRFYDIAVGTSNVAMHPKTFNSPNRWFFNPAVAPNTHNDNVVVTWEYSGPNHYPGADYSVYDASSGTWSRHPQALATEQGTIVDGRSGDYSGAAPDPTVGGGDYVVNEIGTGGCGTQQNKKCGSDWTTAIQYANTFSP